MTIVLCGSGSGGHITPLLAVANQIKQLEPSARLVFVGERKGKYNLIAENSGVFDEFHYLSTGKFRRYHKESIFTRLFDLKTIVLNVRDIFRISYGIIQGVWLIRRLRADSVLLKGGSVCIPAGVGARLAKAFTVTHDSDAIPGISNRIGGKHAQIHAVAMPGEFNQYPSGKVVFTGLPASDNFREYDPKTIAEFKNHLKIPAKSRVVLIIGGSGGAMRLNNWCAEVIPQLLSRNKHLRILFVTGKNKVPKIDLTSEMQKLVSIFEFSDEVYKLAAVSDVIITRAGATTIAEFAQSGKALILVPNPDLTGGHQLKNAEIYAGNQSAIVVSEKEISKDSNVLLQVVEKVLEDSDLEKTLATNLHKTLPKNHASLTLAKILLNRVGDDV